MKEGVALAVEVRQVPKLEAELKELKETTTKLHNTHQAEVKGLCVVHEAEVERL